MALARCATRTPRDGGGPHGSLWPQHSCRTRARSRSCRSPRASSRFSSGGAAGPRCDRRRRPCCWPRSPPSSIAVGVYYAHFLDTYRTELARIGGETAAAAPDAGGRGIADRLASVPRYLQVVLRRPGAGARRWGAALLWQRGARDRTSLAAAGWLLTCGLFLVLGILTPVDMRYYLAAIPALALWRPPAAPSPGRRAASSRRRAGAARLDGLRRAARVVGYAWVVRLGSGSGELICNVQNALSNLLSLPEPDGSTQ